MSFFSVEKKRNILINKCQTIYIISLILIAKKYIISIVILQNLIKFKGGGVFWTAE